MTAASLFQLLLLNAALNTAVDIYPSSHTNGTIECTSSTSCNVICNNGTSTCNQMSINGYSATSLTVYCGSETCANLTVSCPAAGCTLDCAGDSSCIGASIVYNGTTADDGEVSLNCHSGHYACFMTVVDAPSVSELNINCSAAFESFNYACHSIEVDAHSADTVNVYLTESHGSGEGVFNVSNANTFNLYARGYLGSDQDVIYAANAGSVTIECVAESPSGACYDGTWYLPSDAVLECYGTGCANMGNAVVEPNATELTVNVYSCSQCLDAAGCFNEFELGCDGNTLSQSFGSGACATDEDDCGCETLIGNAEFYVAKNADSCYTPTDTISCDPHQTECTITCDNATLSCADMVIDGSDAAHLTVICGSDRYCLDTIIVCPDAGCVVQCTENKACHDTNIIYHGEVADGATVSIECTVKNGCYNTVLDAPDAHTVLIASHAEGMYYGRIDVNNADTVHLNATDLNAIRRSIVYAANVSNMVIDCEHASACFHNDLYLPSDPLINCYGKGCWNMGYLYFPDSAISATWKVDGGCGACNSTFNCINHFQLECGRYSDGSSGDHPYAYNYSVSYTFDNEAITDQEFWSNETCQEELEKEDCGCYDLMNGDIEFTECNTPSPTESTTSSTATTGTTMTTLISGAPERRSLFVSVAAIVCLSGMVVW